MALKVKRTPSKITKALIYLVILSLVERKSNKTKKLRKIQRKNPKKQKKMITSKQSPKTKGSLEAGTLSQAIWRGKISKSLSQRNNDTVLFTALHWNFSNGKPLKNWKLSPPRLKSIVSKGKCSTALPAKARTLSQPPTNPHSLAKPLSQTALWLTSWYRNS